MGEPGGYINDETGLTLAFYGKVKFGPIGFEMGKTKKKAHFSVLFCPLI